MGSDPEMSGDFSELAAGERSVCVGKAPSHDGPQRPQRFLDASPKSIPKAENGCLDHHRGGQLLPPAVDPTWSIVDPRRP